MSSDGSVTIWMRELENGDSRAAEEIWHRYYARLVELARKKLRSVPKRVADEEDVVISAFESFCRAAGQRRFPKLEDRDDLWQVLVMLTGRKAMNQALHNRRQKRGGGNVRGDSVFVDANFEDIVGKEPTPAFASIVAEELRVLLTRLGDDTLRRVAVSKMEGYSNEEVAKLLDCSSRTVVRKIRLIRKILTGNG